MMFFGFFWIACALSLFNPIIGVVNYLLVYQIDPRGTWWGGPISQFGVRYSLVAALCTLLGCIFGRRFVPRIAARISMWEAGVIGLVVIAALGTLYGRGYGPTAVMGFEKLWKMMVFVLVLTRLVTTRSNLQIILWTIVVGSFYLGWDAYTSPTSSFTEGRLDKIGGSDFSTTSGFAAHLSSMLPLIGAAFLTAKRWDTRILATLTGALCMNAVIMCRTRSAFIGLVLGIVTAICTAPRAKRFRIHSLLAASCICAFLLTDNAFWNRMSTLTGRETMYADRATVTRMAIWNASFDIIADYPFGVGIGNFTQVIGDYDPLLYKRASHNTVLLTFVELGIPGGIIFLSLAFGSLWLSFRCSELALHTRNPLETQLIAYGLLVSCVTYLITGLGTERLLCESLWWVLALPLCHYRVVRREMENRAETMMPNSNLGGIAIPESQRRSIAIA